MDVEHAELVFHVLSHVQPEKPLNASLFEPKYVDFCRSALGDISTRPLGQDVRVLARLLSSHEPLAHVQLLAWLFEDEGEKWDERELSQLPDDASIRRDVLTALQRRDQHAVELLRCAVALERPHFRRLPASDRRQQSSLYARVSRLAPCAPRLDVVCVDCCRALGRRGRACGDSILVGLPEGLPFSPRVEHAAFQAAHEAVVQEVSRTAALPFLETEHVALTVLKVRVLGTPLQEEHAQWLRHLDLSQFGGERKLVPASLGPRARAVAETLLSR